LANETETLNLNGTIDGQRSTNLTTNSHYRNSITFSNILQTLIGKNTMHMIHSYMKTGTGKLRNLITKN
jgi:hypothetical protein